jgi:hypothetical protein
MTGRFALVCCGKQKLAAPAPAKDMYRSTLFKKTRAYVEKEYDGWFVLSALHKVISPDQEIAPYDVTLEKGAAALWAEQTAAELAKLLPSGCAVDYFGGALYEPVVGHLQNQGFKVERPLKGLQIGERLHWLKERESAVGGDALASTRADD